MSYVLISESARPVMTDYKKQIRVFLTRQEAEPFKEEVWNSDQETCIIFQSSDPSPVEIAQIAATLMSAGQLGVNDLTQAVDKANALIAAAWTQAENQKNRAWRG